MRPRGRGFGDEKFPRGCSGLILVCGWGGGGHHRNPTAELIVYGAQQAVAGKQDGVYGG